MLLHYGEVSSDEAERLFHKTIEMANKGEILPEWWHTLGFSEYEVMAWSGGATLTDLVMLRYEGWPTVCCRCRLSINHETDIWIFVNCDQAPGIEHVECP